MTAICDQCGSGGVMERLAEQRFEYGSGDHRAILVATVPVSECASCGDAWTGWKGEAARDAAVREHLKQQQTPARTRAEHGGSND
jgi:YgiT-type zinc finger domain-containing protein